MARPAAPAQPEPARRQSHWSDVPLPQREVWTLNDLASMCGQTYPTVKRLLVVDNDDPQRGVIRLPGGVNVPAWRDQQASAWRLYRRHWEKAVDQAAEREDS